jgi:uncharacterized protein with FMN-binding domain
MKKILLSISVLGTFFLYAFFLKKNVTAENIESGNILPPNNISQGNYETPAPTISAFQNSPGLSLPTSRPAQTTSGYKDGVYKGSVADAYYGYVQVQVSISGGKIVDVQFLQYPNDRSTSVMINQQAMPYLKQETLTAQSAQVDYVSGATQTSRAFIESLTSALQSAT